MFGNRIFSISTDDEFNSLALDLFRYQADECEVYKNYLNHLKVTPSCVKNITDIPFLPIEFFKRFEIISGTKKPTHVFWSSGTTGMQQSKHAVTDISVYEQSYLKGFEHFYGDIKEYTVLALLPSYLEREGSSLIYMVADLIQKSNNHNSGFYLNNMDDLISKLIELNNNETKVLLIGVTYALLDLIEQHQFTLKNTIIMETGGMKGRRKELIRVELHSILCQGFGVDVIHSEYGMTELLSQAYSRGNGIFKTPPWMKVMIRDTEDATSFIPNLKSGGINVIDLANYNSCAFIATQDLGKKHSNTTFEVLGRFDTADIRGCNLLIE